MTLRFYLAVIIATSCFFAGVALGVHKSNQPPPNCHQWPDGSRSCQFYEP